MKLKILDIFLDDLNLKNDIYEFHIIGLFDIEKYIGSTDLYSDGTTIVNEKNTDKKMVLNGHIFTHSYKEHFLFNSILGKKGLKKLRVNVEGFGWLESYVVVRNKITTEEGIVGKISCELIAPDPYLYGETKLLYINESKGNGIRFPLKFPIKFEKTESEEFYPAQVGLAKVGLSKVGVFEYVNENPSLSKFIENEGSVVAYPVIRISGSCRNFVVQNLTTKERLQFDIELSAKDELVIDNRPRTRGIYLNGINKIGIKNGNWISCIPGPNEFAFSRISLSNESLCTIELQSRWI